MVETTFDKLSIKAWAESDRPREKLNAKGRNTLTDAELIAILIGSGNREESAVELSRRILSAVNNNLNELGKLEIADLTQFNGIGEAKAISIIAALELGRRRKEHEPTKKPKVNGSIDAYKYIASDLEDLPHEEFWVMMLNRGNKIIGKVPVSKGGISGTVVDSKLIFKAAIENLASAIILCHNHPSGSIQASNADKTITHKIKEAGKLLEIPVLDHLIIGDGSYLSFADEGIL